MDGTRSLVSDGELLLYGVIDPQGTAGDAVRAVDVIGSLGELAGTSRVTARINSPGGSLYEGVAIYNALRACGKPVTVQVDALAASAASIIAMAGDEILVADNASIMIHDPFAVAMGGSNDFRAAADEMDRVKGLMVQIYAQRTGADPDVIAELMAAETYMSASDAVERGFATGVAQALKIAACAKLSPATLAKLVLAKATIRVKALNSAAPAAQSKDVTMTTPAESGAPGGNAPAAGAAPPDLTGVRAEAARHERERVSGILHAVRAAKLDHGFADEMIRAGTPLTDVHAKIIDKWADTQARAEGDGKELRPERSHLRVENDASDRWAQGVTQALLMKMGVVKADRSNEFVGLGLVEMARQSLDVRNVRSGGLNQMDMVGRAFTVRAEGPGYHSTSDFPSILQNVVYKSMMRGYTEADETFDQWTGKGSLSDFRPAYRVDTGLFPALDKVDEGAEYKYGTVTDTGVQVVLATYGKMFAITRQAVINDDLNYFAQVPLKMGRAAKRTIGNLVYAVINTNPVMQDGIALFHASHGNLAGTGTPPTAAAIGAARTAMRRQKDPDGNSTGVGIVPKFILVPPELWDTTNTVLKAQYLDSNAGLQPNYAQNAATPITDNRLSAYAWFLAADPAVTDTIEVDYLDGNEEPFLDQRQGWSVDGAEFKVRIDAGVKALHWRGLYKNAGQ